MLDRRLFTKTLALGIAGAALPTAAGAQAAQERRD